MYMGCVNVSFLTNHLYFFCRKIIWTYTAMTHGVVHYFQHTPSDSRFAAFLPHFYLLKPFLSFLCLLCKFILQYPGQILLRSYILSLLCSCKSRWCIGSLIYITVQHISQYAVYGLISWYLATIIYRNKLLISFFVNDYDLEHFGSF
jgi:hypothetical protein